MKISDQIIGHSEQIAQLQSDLDSGNVSHAYLFTGPESIGKMTVARWFAAKLLTQEVSEKDRAAVISRIEHLIHPDFLVLDKLWIEEDFDNWNEIAKWSNVPQEHRSKAPKARTDTISIDDVRALQARLIETSSSKYFVCIIRNMERMQDSAANAFLKILEEPPSKVIFLLTTGNEAQVLPTVISRTRLIHFHPVSNLLLRPLTASLEPADAHLLLQLARGAPGRLLTLKGDADLLSNEKQLQSQVQHFWQDFSVSEKNQWLLTLAKENPASLDKALLHLGLALREIANADRKIRATNAYNQLILDLQTNAHRALLLQRFAVALEAS